MNRRARLGAKTGAKNRAGDGSGSTLDLFLRTNLFLYFRARAVGEILSQRFGLSTGQWSLMRSVIEEGPQTVADIARARPVARQGVQRMADQLERDGMIEYVDNPAHRRARLVRVTAKGEDTLRRLNAAFGPEIARLASAFSEQELESAHRAVKKLSDTLAALLSELQSGGARIGAKAVRERARNRRAE